MFDKLTENRRKEIASLVQRKYRERLGQMLVEGVRGVEAAVDSKAPLLDIVVSEDRLQDPAIRGLAERAGVPVYALPERDMSRLSDVKTSQGILAVASTLLIQEAELLECRTILALDGVQDPGNLGTIIRTAAWFGVEAVAAGLGTVDFFNPKVVRSAMGGLWDVRLVHSLELGATLEVLRRRGFLCYGAALHGIDLPAWKPQKPSVLVLGSEAHGLSPAVSTQLDQEVCIQGSPARRATESLNVGIAAGILMHHWVSAT